MSQQKLLSVFSTLLRDIDYIAPTTLKSIDGCDAIHGEHHVAGPKL